jgi:hydroxyethylthiazole kinase-like uncharacterized protein yjeF
VKLVTAEEMRAIERRAGEEGITIPELVRRAGAAVAAAVRELGLRRSVLILVGPGNNGGDGLEAGDLLQTEGRDVCCYTFKREDLRTYQGRIMRAEDDPGGDQLRACLQDADIVVDALLGTGQNRPPRDTLASILHAVDRAGKAGRTHLALDVPTGVNADTGGVPGPAFRADLTVCMGLAKRGIALYPGAEYAGQVRVSDLDIPPGLADSVQTTWTTPGQVRALLPRRAASGNKGSSGSVLFVGGSQDFVGAPMLSSLGAYRAGAGLVEIAVPASIQLAVAAHALEPVYRRLPEEDGKITPAAIETLAKSVQKADAIVLGPGMGLSETTIGFVERWLPVLAGSSIKGLVVDADGLNALARIAQWWRALPATVVTPHPGEMARLMGTSIAQVQRDRVGAAVEHARRWGVVVVLKGAGTVVAAPDGRAAVNPTGGPNLATGGTGDVLSGIIGSLISQGCAPWDAAVAGAYWHGRAGDVLRTRLGDAGTLAGDLPGVLPEARLSILSESGGSA